MRIRGKIGDWPVDLTIELNGQELQELAGAVSTRATTPGSRGSTNPAQDAVWVAAQTLLREQEKMDGPDLMGELTDLTGSESAAKRLLMKLRHCDQVKVSGSNGGTVTYHWLADE